VYLSCDEQEGFLSWTTGTSFPPPKKEGLQYHKVKDRQKL
jgi:hypothetical protein